jgi:hypothetical protein
MFGIREFHNLMGGVVKIDLPAVVMITSESNSTSWPILEVIDTETKDYWTFSSTSLNQRIDIAKNDNQENIWFGINQISGTNPTFGLYKYSKTGTKLKEIKVGTGVQSEDVKYVAVDESGNVYVAAETKIYKYNSEGVLQTASFSTAASQIVYRNNYLYVHNGALVKFDTNLNLIWEYTPVVGGPPYRMSVDSLGNSYFSDGGHNLRQVSPTGSAGWTRTPGNQLTFSLDVDDDDFIYVSNSGGSPYKYNTSGVTQSINGPSQSTWFAINNNGLIHNGWCNGVINLIETHTKGGDFVTAFTYSTVNDLCGGLPKSFSTFRQVV